MLERDKKVGLREREVAQGLLERMNTYIDTLQERCGHQKSLIDINFKSEFKRFCSMRDELRKRQEGLL